MSALTLFGVMYSTPLAFAQGTHNHTQMTVRLNARLTQEVKDGKITDAQKQLILSELQSVKGNKIQLKGMTKAQKQAFFQTQRTNLLTWAKQNGINPTYIFGTHTKGAHTLNK